MNGLSAIAYNEGSFKKNHLGNSKLENVFIWFSVMRIKRINFYGNSEPDLTVLPVSN